MFASGRKVEYEVETFDDPLDALMKINCDSLINMILHYLCILRVSNVVVLIIEFMLLIRII